MASTPNPVEVSSEIEECTFAMVLSSAYAFPMTVRAAIELDVLEIIAKAGPGARLSPFQIAAHITTKNAEAPIMLDRILRLLTSYSILACTHRTLDNGQLERLYGLAPVCKFFVRNDDGVSLAPLLATIHDKVLMETWHVESFHSITEKILETYTGFEGLYSLVDVGGGVGVTIYKIVSKYPKIKGINFDQPHVVARASAYSGVEHVGGDMFASVPAGEAIFMKWILHDWSDEHCLRLLKNCYNALPDNGKVIVVEYILPSKPDASVTSRLLYQLDLLMLAYSPGGKERTEEEFEELAKGSGFAGITKACTAYNMSVLEFYKKM